MQAQSSEYFDGFFLFGYCDCVGELCVVDFALVVKHWFVKISKDKQ